MVATLRNPNRPRPATTAAPKPAAPGTTGDTRTDADEPVEAPDKWWRESSFDLRHGLEVREEDTIPGQLLDELFTPKKPKPKA
jgi:hypothetical protein